jgi:amino acid transporter
MPSDPPPAAVLRPGYLNRLENAAQSLGTLAPSVTIGIGLPIILGESGHASLLLMGLVLVLFLGVAAGVHTFAARCSSAGSLGAYTAMGLGRQAGIAASWTYILAMAFVAISAAVCGQFCIDLLLDQWIGPAHGPGRFLVVPSALIAAAWFCAHRDVRLSTKVMLASEMTSLALLGTIMLIALAKGRWWDAHQLDFSHTPWNAVRIAFITAATTLAGFESASTLGEEVTDARRTVPRTMLLCLIPTGLLYLLSTYSLGLLEDRYHVHLDDASMPFDLLAHTVGIPILGTVSLAGIAVSSFAAALAGINAASRVMYDLARQRALPRALGFIHPTHATPTRAVALFAVAGIVVPAVLFLGGVTVTDSINYTIQVASYGYMASYLFVCLAAFAYLVRGRLGPGLAGAAAAGFLAMVVVLGLSVVPLPEAPWTYVAFVSLALPGCGMAWSQLCLRRRSEG